ncbi:MAG: hypothetical protein D3907_09655 [Candidatus Electrothrix sp. AUS3]|jgi:hypothetical protein|nr:hypothetical protein [Candidatus Electrothrix gigas]
MLEQSKEDEMERKEMLEIEQAKEEDMERKRKEMLGLLNSIIDQVKPRKIILGILAGVALMGFIRFITPCLQSSTSFDVEAIHLWHCICLGIVLFNRP